MFAATIPVGDASALLSLLGSRDQNLRQICDSLQVDITAKDDQIHVTGGEQAVAQATEVFEQLKGIVSRDGAVLPEQVSATIARIRGESEGTNYPELEIHCPGRQIRPQTAGQAGFVRAMQEHEVVFCMGPAGTGKTYLAVAYAVAALKQQLVHKIVLVRPAVEAGESLGFLPGDLQAKINPYLRPLLDALREMIDYDQIKRYTEEDIIEMIPLAYMRGRTLNEAFIILDEAQNTTVAQMKMFLTRMGRNSRIVVAGDTTQVDLPRHTRSGMIDAISRLKTVDGVKKVSLTGQDIVRHSLVQEIVRAYEGRRR